MEYIKSSQHDLLGALKINPLVREVLKTIRSKLEDFNSNVELYILLEK